LLFSFFFLLFFCFFFFFVLLSFCVFCFRDCCFAVCCSCCYYFCCCCCCFFCCFCFCFCCFCFFFSIPHIQMFVLIQQSKSLNDTMPNMKSWFYILSISFSLSNALAQIAEGIPSGYELMTSKQYGNCIACHDMPGVQGLVSNFAPSLKGVGQKFSAQELTQWVVDARLSFCPITLMPPFGSTNGLNLARPNRVVLTNEQIALVVSSLQSFR